MDKPKACTRTGAHKEKLKTKVNKIIAAAKEIAVPDGWSAKTSEQFSGFVTNKKLLLHSVMKLAKRTYYKALVLAAVFSMNTAVSFACSFSKLFHGIHHHQPAAGSPAGHEHSGNHHAAAQGGKPQHDNQLEHKHESGSANDPKDDCCSGSVVDIQKVEKAASRAIEAPLAPLTGSFVAAYFFAFHLNSVEDSSIPARIRWRPPATIPDLRIVIQSFQI